jgi:uncharacterized membrane protein YqiK
MGFFLMFIGLVAAVAGLAFLPKVPAALRTALAVLVLLLIVGSLLVSSVRFVGANETGIVTKNAFGKSLDGGKIIAVNGEAGVQADVMSPGWHMGYWPVIFSVKTVPLIEIRSVEIGLIETRDGQPLDEGQLFAPEWKIDEVQKMLDARYFLTTGKGRKGKQATVLTPGKYRINTEMFKITMTKQTEVHPGEVAVLKANYGRPPSVIISGVGGAVATGRDDEHTTARSIMLAGPGEMGVRAEVLPPGKYAINTDAFTVSELWTTQMVAHYTANQAAIAMKPGETNDERDITVRTVDGFTFPVDVRVEYTIEAKNAPLVVSLLKDDEDTMFRNLMNSAVRATFRNSAENVRALDYVQQRSQQESMSLTALQKGLARYGISVTAVRIGSVGDEKTLGSLLKTQTDRELAKQEQLTFQEQQKAAEKKKELSRTTQESEEEKKLASAAYSVKIAEETKKQKIAEAGGEAEAIKIRATAQAEAYKEISLQIGKSNAALVEILKIVGEKNIQITPRIMISGAGATGTGPGGRLSSDAANTALIGTMLDAMIGKDEEAKPATQPK